MKKRLKPAFLITIDTEEDNSWSKPVRDTTENVRFLSRFQELCEQYGFKPTWLTNYPVAKDAAFVEFGNDVIKRNAGEVGMHLHAWNTLPEQQLTHNDREYNPYLYEYPVEIMRDKIHCMTSLLEETFNRPIISHRAGRWGFNEQYAQLLVERGYKVDCSVTPFETWQFSKGLPSGTGGPDFRGFPTTGYYCDMENLQRQSDSGLLELPMTIVPRREKLRRMIPEAVGKFRNGRRFLKLLAPYEWLRPTKYRNALKLIWVVEQAIQDGRDYIEFMLHSSELMPGGSPTFPTASSIEQLYDDLEQLFEFISKHFIGMTLAEYSGRVMQQKELQSKTPLAISATGL